MITGLQGAESMLEQLRAFRAEAAGQNIDANRTVGDVHSDFGTMLQQALSGVNDTMVGADNLKTRFELGDESVSLSDVMIASQKASMAFEATVQVRNKCMEAYKTIMQMQV